MQLGHARFCWWNCEAQEFEENVQLSFGLPHAEISFTWVCSLYFLPAFLQVFFLRCSLEGMSGSIMQCLVWWVLRWSEWDDSEKRKWKLVRIHQQKVVVFVVGPGFLVNLEYSAVISCHAGRLWKCTTKVRMTLHSCMDVHIYHRISNIYHYYIKFKV